MRITDSMIFDSVVANIGLLQGRLPQASRQAQTGERISAPSDDPVGAAQLARVQASIDQTDAYRATIQSARGDVELAEGALANISDLFSSAKEIALQAGTGTVTSETRTVMANEVTEMQQEFVSLTNTKGGAGYVFSGTATGTPTFSSAGVFQANSADRNAEIAPGQTVAINVSGAQAFTAAGGRDVYGDLQALQTALAANNVSAIQATVSNLDKSYRQIVNARAGSGITLDRFETADSAHQSVGLALASSRHQIADANPAQAFSTLAAVQNSLQQALEASRTTLAALNQHLQG